MNTIKSKMLSIVSILIILVVEDFILVGVGKIDMIGALAETSINLAVCSFMFLIRTFELILREGKKNDND